MKRDHRLWSVFRHATTLAVVLLFAAGSLVQLGASGSQEAATAETPTKLVVWMPAYIQAAVDFMRATAAERFPETEIEITPYPANEYPVKMTSALAANSDVPDVLISHHPNIPRLIAAGVRDLTEWVDPLRKDLIPAALGPVSDAAGHVYGVPFEITHTAYFYRQDIYNQFGIKPPATLNDMIQIGGKLEAQGKYVTAGDQLNGDAELFEDLLLQYGGNYFDAGGNLIFGKPEGKGLEALTMFKKIADAGVIFDSEFNSPGWFDAFVNGDVASLLFLSWYPKRMRVTIKDPSVGGFGQWRLTSPPVAGPNTPKVALYGNVSAMINKNSRYPQFAWDYIQFLTMEEGPSTKIMNDFAILSAHKGNLEKMTQGSDPWPLFGDQQITAIEAKMLLSSEHAHISAEAYSEARNIVKELLVDLSAGKSTPKETLDTAVEKIETAIKTKY
jgi:ABC-type glycerol-3-phosphate transport system substrate-binding protein